MSTEPLPRLQPFARQGAAYYAELRAILREIEPQVRADIRTAGTITPVLIGQLALRYAINFKAMCEALEGWRLVPCGTYDRITAQHRPTAILRAAMEERR